MDGLNKSMYEIGSDSAFSILARSNQLLGLGKDVINLGIGQPDFPTPKNIIESACKALKDGHHGYTPSNGLLKLRESVSKYIFNNYKTSINPENILITPGGKPVIFFASLIFGEQGSEIIYPDPGFIVERKDNLLGIVLTHAHEDHIGAIAHLWPKLQCKIFATPFTAVLIREKFREKQIELTRQILNSISFFSVL